MIFVSGVHFILLDIRITKRSVSEYKQERHGFPIHNQHKKENTENNPEKPMKTKRVKNYEQYMKYFRRGKDSTKQRNAFKLWHFSKWIKMTPEGLIAEYEKARVEGKLDSWEREQVNRINEYYNHIINTINPKTDKPYSINYARNEASGISAFHKQNTRALQNVFTEIAPPQIATDEYRFSQDDLRKMFYYGDTKEKALISIAVSFGQGSKEFLELECEHIKSVIEEARDKGFEFAKWIGKARAKTSIQPRSFLTPEAMESASEYLDMLQKKYGKLPKYLWSNGQLDKHITNQGLNKQFRRLVDKANIRTHGKYVHFHLIRKFTFSRIRRHDRDIAKVICAKAVSASDMTYEELDDICEKVFRLAYKDISLNGDVSGKTKRAQKEEIERLKQELAEQKLVMKGMLEVYGMEIAQKAIEKLKKEGKLTVLKTGFKIADYGTIENLKELLKRIAQTSA